MGANKSIQVHNSAPERCHTSCDQSLESGYLDQGQRLTHGVGPDGYKTVHIKVFDRKNRMIKSASFSCWCNDNWIVRRDGIKKQQEGQAPHVEEVGGRHISWSVNNETYYQQQDALEEQRRREAEAARQRALAEDKRREEEALRAGQQAQLEELRNLQESRQRREAQERQQREDDERNRRIESSFHKSRQDAAHQNNQTWAATHFADEENRELNEFKEQNTKYVGSSSWTEDDYVPPPPDYQATYLSSMQTALQEMFEDDSLKVDAFTELSKQFGSNQEENRAAIGVKYSSPEIHLICLSALEKLLLSRKSLPEFVNITNFLFRNFKHVIHPDIGEFDEPVTTKVLEIGGSVAAFIAEALQDKSSSEITKLLFNSGAYYSDTFDQVLITALETHSNFPENKESWGLVKKLAQRGLLDEDPTMFNITTRLVVDVSILDVEKFDPTDRLNYFELLIACSPSWLDGYFREHPEFRGIVVEFLWNLANPYINKNESDLTDDDELEMYKISQLVLKRATQGWFQKGSQTIPIGILKLMDKLPSIPLNYALARHFLDILQDDAEHYVNYYYEPCSSLLAKNLQAIDADHLFREAKHCADFFATRIAALVEIPLFNPSTQCILLNMRKNLLTAAQHCKEFMAAETSPVVVEQLVHKIQEVTTDPVEFELLIKLIGLIQVWSPTSGAAQSNNEVIGGTLEKFITTGEEQGFVVTGALVGALEMAVGGGFELQEESVQHLLKMVIVSGTAIRTEVMSLLCKVFGQGSSINCDNEETVELCKSFGMSVKAATPDGLNEMEWELLCAILLRFPFTEELFNHSVEIAGLI